MKRNALHGLTFSQANSLAAQDPRSFSNAPVEGSLLQKFEQHGGTVPRHSQVPSYPGVAQPGNIGPTKLDYPSTPKTPGSIQPLSQVPLNPQQQSGSRIPHPSQHPSQIPAPQLQPFPSLPGTSTTTPQGHSQRLFAGDASAARRMTLASGSAVMATPDGNQGFSRLSLAPPSISRMSLGPTASAVQMSFGPPPSVSRNSLAPSAVNHGTRGSLAPGEGPPRQSLAGGARVGGKGGQQKGDPRKVANKQQQQKWAYDVAHFLAEHNYDRTVTGQQLQSCPSNKDFLHMFSFIVRFIDPGFNFSSNPGEDMYNQLKWIGFPYSISKGSLGQLTPHQWPTMLGMLFWISQQAYLTESVKDITGYDKTMEYTVEDYIGKMYRCFLQNDSQGQDAMYRDLGQILLDGAMQHEHVLFELKEEHATLKGHANFALNTPSLLEPKRQERNEIASDLLQLKEAIQEQLQSRQAMEQTKVALVEALESRKKELAAIKESNAELKEKVASQRVQLADFQLMAQDRRNKEEALRRLHGEIQALQSEHWGMEVEAARQMQELQDLARQYTDAATRFQISPPGAKRSGEFDFRLKINTSGATWDEILVNPDKMKGEMREWLKQLADECRGAAEEAEKEAMLAEAEIMKLQPALASLESSHKEAHRRMERMDQEMKAERERGSQTVAGIEAEIMQIQRDMESMLQQREAHAHSLETRLKVVSSRCQDQATQRKMEEDNARANLMTMKQDIFSNIAAVDRNTNRLKPLAAKEGQADVAIL